MMTGGQLIVTGGRSFVNSRAGNVQPLPIKSTAKCDYCGTLRSPPCFHRHPVPSITTSPPSLVQFCFPSSEFLACHSRLPFPPPLFSLVPAPHPAIPPLLFAAHRLSLPLLVSNFSFAPLWFIRLLSPQEGGAIYVENGELVIANGSSFLDSSAYAVVILLLRSFLS